jgi:myo-inositol catabolism protein IolH
MYRNNPEASGKTMQIALDPYMHRNLSLREVVELTASLGYEHLELSWREDFIPLFKPPRANRSRITELKAALASTGVSLASVAILYRWASGDQEERTAAVRYWMKALDVMVELGCRRVNSEFGGSYEDRERSEAAFWMSLDAVLPRLESEDITLDIEPHPGDFVEESDTAVDLIRSTDSEQLRYLYCVPHTFHMGDQIPQMLAYASPVLSHVHLADTFDHRKGRYIVNPIGSTVRVHQHLNIGDGEIDWDATFAGLRAVNFDDLITSSVFGCEDRAVESSRQMLATIKDYVRRNWLTEVLP